MFERYSEGLDDYCDKCGNPRASFLYHPYCEVNGFEHLHYSCHRCGYDWTGETVDKKFGPVKKVIEP